MRFTLGTPISRLAFCATPLRRMAFLEKMRTRSLLRKKTRPHSMCGVLPLRCAKSRRDVTWIPRSYSIAVGARPLAEPPKEPRLHHLYSLIFSRLPAEHHGFSKHEIFMVSYSHTGGVETALHFRWTPGREGRLPGSMESQICAGLRPGSPCIPNSPRWRNQSPIAVSRDRAGAHSRVY